MRRALVGLAHRVAWAALISVFIWYLYVVLYSESPFPRAAQEWLLKILDLPVAAVNALLPWQWKAIDVWSSERQPEYGSMWRLLHVHLRTSVPVYVALFYLPNLIAWIVRRIRRGRASGRRSR